MGGRDKTMNLSTTMYSHVIITYTKAHYFITPMQEERLKSLGQDDIIEIDDNKIKGRNIAEVMTTKKYYETFPEKKQNDLPLFISSERQPMSKERYTHAIKSMIRGINGYINSPRYQGTDKPIKLRTQMEEKLKAAESSREDFLDNPIKDFYKSI